MKINDEGTSNAAHWYERAMKAESRLAEAEAKIAELRDALGCEMDDTRNACAAVNNEIDRVNKRLAEAEALIDDVDTLAVNNNTGCGTCSTIQNLTTTYLLRKEQK